MACLESDMLATGRFCSNFASWLCLLCVYCLYIAISKKIVLYVTGQTWKFLEPPSSSSILWREDVQCQISAPSQNPPCHPLPPF